MTINVILNDLTGLTSMIVQGIKGVEDMRRIVNFDFKRQLQFHVDRTMKK